MDDGHKLAVGYAELAFAILVWDNRQEPGTCRSKQLLAELKLKSLAKALRDVGYRVGS